MNGKTSLISNGAKSLAHDAVNRLFEASVLASCEFLVKRQFVNVKAGALVAIMISAGVILAGLFVLARRTWSRREVEASSLRIRRPSLPSQVDDLRRSTKCPFARAARLVGCSLAGPGNLERRIVRLVPRLTRMTREGREKRLDGLILRIPAKRFAADLEMLSKTLNQVLRVLAKRDPTGGNCFALGDLIAEDWQFSFNGTRFFITTFAPFYGVGHCRYSGRKDSAFIYFQPEYSFDHHGISAANPDRERLKERVRQTFAEAGIAYSVTLVKQPIEAYKYVKPPKVGDPPVEWWNVE